MMNPQKLVFAGNYGQLCQNFINYKRSLGYAYDIRQCYSVKYLCDYLSDKNGASSGLSKDVVEGFIRYRASESASTQSKRVYIIRQFGMYLTSIGYTSYLPPYDCIKQDKSFIPYIYSKDEITAIIAASEKLKKVHHAPNSYLVYPMLLRILFGCGLRVSEALRLTEADVDLDNGILYVEKSKSNNSRVIPMAPGLWNKCIEYYHKVGHYPANGRYLFEVSPGVPYQRGSVYNRFRFFLEQAGISHNGRGNGPRLHDARYPNLNKIQTFQQKYQDCNKYLLKRFGFYFYPFLLTPQKSTRDPSGFFHFADTFLSFSSSSVASAFAFSSVVMSR